MPLCRPVYRIRDAYHGSGKGPGPTSTAESLTRSSMHLSRVLATTLSIITLLAMPLARAASLYHDPNRTPSVEEMLAFEAAVQRYGGTGLENLLGHGCSSRHKAQRVVTKNGSGVATCVVAYSPSLDQPLELPAIFVFQPKHDYWGTQERPTPPRQRGIYLYRFSAGVLEPGRHGAYRITAEGRSRIPVRASQVVAWNAILSNDERTQGHESLPYTETLITPAGARIFHCKVWGRCDPLKVSQRDSWGLCEGRTRVVDNVGATSKTPQVPHQPMPGTGCEARSIVTGESVWETQFQRFVTPPQGTATFTSMGNSWQIQDTDPPGSYRIEVRISGQLIGALDFEVQR